MESDDEETFVTIGTQLELVDDDVPKKKPISFHDLPVKDKQGRVRFHGAFTGGFSAGYFNSVGSKDGWSPSTFVSSRDRDKHEDGKAQRPEDFMDEEDFSEHGIAPRKHQISDNFSSEVKKRQRIQEANAATSGTIISGAPALADLIVPEKLSVGIKLLRKLGWKEGQGIGPRRQKKRNIVKKKETQPGLKIYGCVLPSRDSGSNSEDASDDEDLSQITFAPKDVTPISLAAKDNVHGIGYRGIDPRIALPSTHISLFEPPPISKSGRKAIRGHAFGVGALEDDDEDIYATDHLSNYDITMGGDEEEDDLFGWTAPGRGEKKKSKVTPIGYIGKVLEGFTLSSQPLKQKKSYAPPSLPPDYRPVCPLVKPVESMDLGMSQNQHGRKKALDAVSRGLVLGETPILSSVFDLVSKEDRDKMHTVKSSQNSEEYASTPKRQNAPQQADPAIAATDKVTSVPDPTSSDSKVKSSGSRWDQKTSSDSEQQSVPLFRGGDLLFKPFIKDSRKQERYDKYQHLIKQGVRDAYAKVSESHMTEWEQKREEEEFIKASKLYQPMSGMIASRFTRAKYHDDDESVELPAEEGDKSDKKNAAEMKMYGHLTRSMCDWHPDKVLCKRFNVPDPYPGSTVVGVPKVKRDKFSVFNFLNFTGSDEQIRGEPLALPAAKSTNGDKDTDVTKRPESSEQISFKISNKSRPALGQSIFSSLMEDTRAKKSEKLTSEKEALSVIKEDSQAVMEDSEKMSKVQNVTVVAAAADDDKPPMDLFEAIFGNTDSEDSGASDNDDSKEIKSEPPPDTLQSRNSDDDAHQTPTTQTNFLPGAPIVIDTIAQRLSGPTDDEVQKGENSVDEYGPALPPKSTVAGSDVTYTDGMSIIDLTQSSYRKHKEKHKHKHKKEKSSNHKKSKHKKKQKKKERKRKKSEQDYKSISSDSQSESEDDATLNREILTKLSAVADRRRLKASDFM